METLDSIDLNGKKVLCRVDFNVPLNEENQVADASRIKAALPTIEKILEKGGRPVLMSHLGRPKGEKIEKFSLKHIVERIAQESNRSVDFIDDCIGDDVRNLINNTDKDLVLLENLRFYSEETEGDQQFAKKLAKNGDVYINDAFGTAHRAHASTAVIADNFDSKSRSFGYLINNELNAVKKVIEAPDRPFTAIMGGAKISDKILLIEQILDKVDHLIIGGGMSYTFFKAQGGEIGNSLVEHDKLALARQILEKATERGVEVHLPQDSIVADRFSAGANTTNADNMNIPEEWMGLDIGENAVKKFTEVIIKSKTILWNGPMGVFEFQPFESGTKGVAKAIAEATEAGAYSLIGGGDSAAAINKFNFQNQVSYISTGGGALLEYLEGKQLPGIKAIQG